MLESAHADHIAFVKEQEEDEKHLVAQCLAGLPMPVYTFLEEYNFTGKTIIPFASHEGSGLGSGPSEIESLCPDATVLNGLAVRGSLVTDSKADIKSWIDGLNLE